MKSIICSPVFVRGRLWLREVGHFFCSHTARERWRLVVSTLAAATRPPLHPNPGHAMGWLLPYPSPLVLLGPPVQRAGGVLWVNSFFSGASQQEALVVRSAQCPFSWQVWGCWQGSCPPQTARRCTTAYGPGPSHCPVLHLHGIVTAPWCRSTYLRR